jgi:hypothetical protein
MVPRLQNRGVEGPKIAVIKIEELRCHITP